MVARMVVMLARQLADLKVALWVEKKVEKLVA